ncbi:MAG: PDZ domain-containing protein [Rhodospirillales bacterium]|nr:PDZ domain-containing protein [Rhodospirillales bacterium]
MQVRRLGLSVLFAAALSALIAGCRSRVDAPVPMASFEHSAFVTGEAEDVFKVGYGAIAQRFLAPISVEDVAVAGLRGLSDIDPRIAVGLVGDSVEVSLDGHPLGSFGTAKARDVGGWARLTVRIWHLAREHSSLIAAATQEDGYKAIFDRVVGALDANSRYATASAARRNRLRRDGYTGIGATIRIDHDEPVIVEINGRGPAERVGLRVGDVVTRIDGVPLAGLSEQEISERLQENIAGWVKITVRRPGRGLLNFVVKRSYLIAETVHERYEDGILVLVIDHFNQGTAESLQAPLKLLATGPKNRLRGIILDLRDNPGGLLQQAVRSADLFLSGGEILSTQGRHPDSDQLYMATGTDIAHGLPVILLVDGETASAAELLAAVLQDRGRAVVVGSTTYGKGTVQTVIPLPNGGELSFTWSQAVPPSGEILTGHGVTPAVCSAGLFVADPDAMDLLLARAAGGEARGEIRECPAERREGEVDVDLARKLIEQPGLYALFLRRPAPLLPILRPPFP